ncbi:short-chain dehydrogenase/reductase SDR [gamma proteobacterium BDW918]|jgi:NAD(P)-dependent dehydrogenase (short-subunit alcohol dehydrogenase family)|uniref:Peroxisomal trans-2-enoyl-CoA reductase n=1 Tax=Zhongshania aliphaticivorans TaxID=1470434 RepID=A0A127M2Q6_9GAMM|nr:SDR family oxidoreductase [Zhongshania aliphaticivorans]AMO67508.1 oxidoreductase [Zhongshania aliphaticivorans]EIF45133.1 short-chain dehydrogenase/reductase SDR [gamma proteobacterium BDW918]|tara:strand:- start:75370 stop:76251 length:882 start_codon:yes stop_codon:yes gene_type:complete
MFNNSTLNGKRILVTGGGTGLGKEISRGLLACGAEVYICGRRESVLQTTCEELGADTGGKIHYRICDIRDPESIDDMVESIFTEGPLSGLINNAAANFISPTKDLSPRGYQAIRSTVMDGSFYTVLAVGKRWINLGIRGSIVSNLVTWVWTGSAYVVPSAMSKTAIDSMTKSLAVEWGPYGIRLNAVAPGPFPTEGAWEKLNPTGKSSGATDSSSVPMRRYGEMPELANLMIFLQADGCDYLTGQTIAIDGGHHLAAPSTFASLSDLSDDDWSNIRENLKASADKEKSERSTG